MHATSRRDVKCTLLLLLLLVVVEVVVWCISLERLGCGRQDSLCSAPGWPPRLAFTQSALP
jgi:hypothetical protein